VSVTAQLIRAWVNSVLKPQIELSVREGVPLDKIGSALIGAGVSALRIGGKMTDDQIRAVVEDVLAGRESGS
jgi:hypothetical protein